MSAQTCTQVVHSCTGRPLVAVMRSLEGRLCIRWPYQSSPYSTSPLFAALTTDAVRPAAQALRDENANASNRTWATGIVTETLPRRCERVLLPAAFRRSVASPQGGGSPLLGGLDRLLRPSPRGRPLHPSRPRPVRQDSGTDPELNATYLHCAADRTQSQSRRSYQWCAAHEQQLSPARAQSR